MEESLKTAEKTPSLRKQFQSETKKPVWYIDGEINIEYVHWLEDKILGYEFFLNVCQNKSLRNCVLQTIKNGKNNQEPATK